MKAKAFAAIMVTLFLVTSLFYAVPTTAQPTIKIGILGPMLWPQGQGMVEGVTLAVDEINTGTGHWTDHAGVNVGGTTYQLEIVTANTGPGGAEPTEESGRAAATELVDAGVDYVQGGFRSEAVFGAREVLMDHELIFFVTGAATNELIDCVTGTCGQCVRCDYDRYKYMFRNTPVNSTILVKTLAAFYQVIAIGFPGHPLAKMLPLYGYVHEGMTRPQVNVAVVTESAVWADLIHLYLTHPAIYPGLLGPYANVTWQARPSPEATSFDAELTGVINNEARLLIPIFSAEAGLAFITQWGDWGVKAVPVGIDVLAQETDHWPRTGGACEFEATLATAGTGCDNTAWMLEFAAKYFPAYGHAPIYTAYGAYDSVYGMCLAIEAANSLDSDTLVPVLEATDRDVMTTPHFKYTEHHDVFCAETGPTWVGGYGRALLVQWQAGRKEVICPIDQPYSKLMMLPRSMYPYPTDISQDGTIGAHDIGIISAAYGTVPGDARWQRLADTDDDGDVDGDDFDDVALDYGKTVALPLPYCSEGGRLSD